MTKLPTFALLLATLPVTKLPFTIDASEDARAEFPDAPRLQSSEAVPPSFCQLTRIAMFGLWIPTSRRRERIMSRLQHCRRPWLP
jgi:hypothetical protein